MLLRSSDVPPIPRASMKAGRLLPCEADHISGLALEQALSCHSAAYNIEVVVRITPVLVALAVFPAVCLAQSASAPSPAPDTCALIVHVTGFRNQKGVAGGTLFKSPDGWPESNTKAFAHAPFPIEGDHATLTFHVPPGRYALAVLHDENGNKKLDRNFLGVPKEGFGFANNPHVGLSAPKWDQAVVNVTCPTTETSIRLIYK